MLNRTIANTNANPQVSSPTVSQQLYHKRMKKAFDRKVKFREFREGDLVLRKIMSFNTDSRGKWTPNFEGPYVVKKAFSAVY